MTSSPAEQGADEPKRGSSEVDEEPLPVDPDLEPDPAGRWARPRSASFGVLVAVFVGGALGTSGRDLLSLAVPESARDFPLVTFAINTSGALVLAFLLTLILERLGPTRYLRPFACVGILGGWTTMSTLAVQADRLFGFGESALALGYLLATLAAGVLAVSIGIALARALQPTTRRE